LDLAIASWRPLDLGAELSQYFPRYLPKGGHDLPVHPSRMIVVTIPNAGNSWFFKMTGDAPLVGAQKDSFLQFVKSVKF
jgi:hypothetical protein